MALLAGFLESLAFFEQLHLAVLLLSDELCAALLQILNLDARLFFGFLALLDVLLKITLLDR